MLVVETNMGGQAACETEFGAQMFLSSTRPVNVRQFTDY